MISFGGWKEAWTYDQFAMCVCATVCVPEITRFHTENDGQCQP